MKRIPIDNKLFSWSKLHFNVCSDKYQSIRANWFKKKKLNRKTSLVLAIVYFHHKTN